MVSYFILFITFLLSKFAEIFLKIIQNIHCILNTMYTVHCTGYTLYTYIFDYIYSDYIESVDSTLRSELYNISII